MVSVTAKPRIAPVPKLIRKMAAIRVVRFASRIDDHALPKPETTEALTVRPLCNSSRIRSNTSTLASTAMPMVRIRPAMPGRVSAAPK